MKLLRAIAMDAMIVACIYGWKVMHLDSARRFLEFYLWFIVAIQIIFVLAARDKDLYHRPKVLVAYDVVSTVALTVALVWFGWVGIAVALFLGWIFVIARLDKYKAAA